MKDGFIIDRKVWQPLWSYIFEDTSVLEGYCEPFENDTFKVRPYSWDDDYHDNSYHFWHKPSNIKIQWYKYPLRGSICNKNITADQFVDVLYDCRNSLETGSIKIIHDVDRWWDSNDVH